MIQNNEEKNKNEVDDLDESNKNEEDLLAFSSKYKTNMYKEEDIKENELNLRETRKRLSCDSTSISISQEYSNKSGCNLKKKNTLSKEEELSHKSVGLRESFKKFINFQEKQRKLSSPMCCYYDGSDKYLSKKQKNTVDIDNSQNFIKKENFFNNSDKNVNSINTNNNINNNLLSKNNLNINLLCQNQNLQNINNDNNNNNNINVNINNRTQKRLSFTINPIPYNTLNNLTGIQNNNFLTNNVYLQNNNIQQQFYNINCININNSINNNLSRRKLSYNTEEELISNYFNNILNLNNSNPIANNRLFNVQQQQQKLNPMLFSYNEEQEQNMSQINQNKNLINKSINSNSKNEKKPFDKRKGDWLCPECHNLNFAFRVVCNRCQLPKPSK